MSECKSRIALTIVIPVRDEERNLAKCLRALMGRFTEIVVVDSNSKDRTVEIAEALGARVVHFSWNGKYPKKRNWVLQNFKFSSDWVLFLDADEIVTERFAQEVENRITNEDFSGYWINYTNVFLGRELRHGLRQRKLALFQINAGMYERIDEDRWSTLDMEVHEHPIILGRVGEISAPIKHEDDRGVYRFLDRHLDYARWEAMRLLALEHSGSWQSLTRRQLFKYRNVRRWWFPYSYFIYTYVVKLGFLDGSAGFYYSYYKMWYFCVIRQLAIEEQSFVKAEPNP
jgi:glycosyltransferase involved in cell wall biosynthesis